MSPVFPKLTPKSLVFITTYKCTSSCPNCCFSCSPHRNEILEPELIKRCIREAKDDLPSLSLAVFTGGECFLLGDTLLALITEAKNSGLRTRCVTNGYWATSFETASREVLRLKNSGLDEINFSGGDEHQVFVPLESIANGAMAACRAGMRTSIVFEGNPGAKSSVPAFLAIKEVAQFIKTDSSANLLSLMTNVWINFNSSQNVSAPHASELASSPPGCTNILDSIVINPNGHLISCCGLTADRIPEMDMGSIQDRSIKSVYDEQNNETFQIKLGLHAKIP